MPAEPAAAPVLPQELRPPCPRGCVDVEGCGCEWNQRREAWPNEPAAACVCGEINTRHCPVHGQGDDAATVRNADDVWAWMNTWGDLYERHEGRTRSRDFREGYEQAIRDLMTRLREMGVENCSDEAWQRFTGRG